MTDNIFQRMEEVRRRLPEMAPKLFNIRTKHKGLAKFEPTWLQQKLWLGEFVGADIILKARQLGVSTMTVIEFLSYFLFVDGFQGFIISKDREHSKYLLDMAHLALQMLPEQYKIPMEHSREDYIISSAPTYNKAGKRIGGGRGSTLYIGTAGQLSFGHGVTVHAAHCSELSRWPVTDKGDAATILHGLEQAVPDVPGAILRIESTPNGRGDVFHVTYQKSKRRTGRYIEHFFPWWFSIGDEYRKPVREAIELTLEETELIERTWELYEFKLTKEHIQWRRDKMAAAPKPELFFEEYPEDAETCFLQSGISVFSDILPVLSANAKRLQGKQPLMQYSNNGIQVNVWKISRSGRAYGMGVDCAEAEKEKSNLHAGVIGEIKNGVCEEAVTFSGRCGVPKLAELVIKLANEYSALVAVERTSQGYALLDRLLEADAAGDQDYQIYYHEEFDQRAGTRTLIPGFRPTRSAIDACIGRWGEDYASGEYIAHDLETIRQAMDYAYGPTGRASAPRGGLDDQLDSALILNYIKDEVDTGERPPDVSTWGV